MLTNVTTGIDRAFSDVPLAAATLFVYGFLDAIAFVVLKGSFVAFMSGNSTVLGASTASSNWQMAIVSALLIILFFAGNVLGASLRRWGGHAAHVQVLAAMAGVVLVGTIIAVTVSPTAGVVAIALAGGLANAALASTTNVHGGLTYVTGTLVKSAHQLVAGIGTDRPWAWLGTFWMWLVFLIGAACGGLGERLAGINALWIATGFSLVLLLVPNAERQSPRHGY